MSTVEFNGSQYDEDVFEEATRYVANQVPGTTEEIRTAEGVLPVLGKQYNADRDIYEVLGYKKRPKIEDYRARFERQDIANRIVKLPAEDTWKEPPSVVEEESDTDGDTDFEQQVNALEQATNFSQYLRRLDTVAGIGQYGLLFIGVNRDNEEISDKMEPDSLSGPEDIAYYQPIAQDSVEDWTLGYEDDSIDITPNNPRWNRPTKYQIDFAPVDSNLEKVQTVDATRIIHVPATEPDESEIKAPPRQQQVLNRLIDLEKVVGSSAEMFYSGADRKFFFNIDGENARDIPDNELDRMDQEAKQLVHEMRQHMKTFNMDVQVVGGDDPDPSGVVDSILKFISGATGIPVRMLVGSERGELASSQDQANWFGYIESRRNTYAEPLIFRRFIDRMRTYGVLPDPKTGMYTVDWANLFELNDLEKSELRLNRAEILERFAGGNPQNLPAKTEQLFDWIDNGEKIEWDSVQPSQLPTGQDMSQLMQDTPGFEEQPDGQTEPSES